MTRKEFILLIFVLLFHYSEQYDDCAEKFDSRLKSICEGLSINNTHSCSYSNGICDYKYKTCSGYMGEDQSICESITPSDRYKKCIMQNKKCTQINKDCSEYEPNGNFYCSSFSPSNTLKYCVSQNNKCESHYRECEDFTEGVDKTKCEANIPSIYEHKCVWDTTQNKCKEVPKDCKDYSSTYFYDCSILTVSSTDKVCVQSDNYNYCEERYKTCELYNTKETTKTKEICEKIKVYSEDGSIDNYKVCEFSGTTCQTKDKVCEDFSSYDCYSFTPKDTNTICDSTQGICKTLYKTCELYDANVEEAKKNKEDCESIRIYLDNDNYGRYDEHHYCSYTGTTCSTKERKCEDIPDQYTCEDYSPTDDTICVFINGFCKEQYKTCEIYNQRVEEANKNKEDCEAIRFYDNGFDAYWKCVFEEGTCSKRKKECSEFTDSYFCNNIQLEDVNKKCRFINDVCEEQYKTCEIYNSIVTTKTKEECEKIIPYINENSNAIDVHSKCIFDDESNCVRKPKECNEIDDRYSCNGHKIDDDHICTLNNENQCTKVYTSCSGYNKETDKTEAGCKAIKIYYSYGWIDYSKKCIYEDNTCKEKILEKCEDYVSGQEESYCTRITNSYSYCTLEDNQCVKHYASCPDDNEEVTEDICNSITIQTGYQKCVFDRTTKKCNLVRKTCSEYEYNIDYICEYYYVPSEDTDNKKCFLENSKCIEKYIYCSAYKGNDKAECESIIPHDEYKSSLANYNKCILGQDNKCQMVPITCKDAKDQNHCEQISLSSSEKHCVYINGECKEQFRTCDYYNNNGVEPVTKTVCESIILTNPSYKCVFTENNKCLQKSKVCSDVKKENFENECTSITSSFSYKKCGFSNSVCSEPGKSCLDLNSESGVTDDICSAAPTSDPNNKICVKKEQGNECEEKDKNSNPSSSSSSSSNPSSSNNPSDNTPSGNNPSSSSSSNTGTNKNDDQKKNKSTFLSEFKFGLLFSLFWLFLQ